jgi:hypothetical protein
MPNPSIHRQGILAVAAFKDTRSVSNKLAIGAARGGFGNRLGNFVVKDGKPIETIMQSVFEDALRLVGYTIVPADQAPVIIEGEVFESWLTSGWNCVDRIGVLVRVRDRKHGTVLWEKEIRGQEDDLISYNNAVRAAVDVTLAKAIQEFCSLDFYEAVQRRNQRALGAYGAPSTWNLFTNVTRGFCVRMPKRPQEFADAHPVDTVQVIKWLNFAVELSPSMALNVAYTDFPQPLSDFRAYGSPEYFDYIQKVALDGLGHIRLISTRDGFFESHPMREVRFEAQDEKMLYQTRFIMAGRRMYNLIVISPMGSDVSREVDTFFNSFHLLYDVPK